MGDSPSDFDVQRNCHYHIRVSPSGSGLDEDSWRIDKSSLLPYGKASIHLHPGNYVEGKVGSDLHIWAEIEPKGSRLSFGEEELEYDKSRGIYDYTMDKDGHGVTLHLKKPGSGILYIEGGAPASAAEMVVVTVLDSLRTENEQVRFKASVFKSPSPSGNAASTADFSLSACLGTEGAAHTDYMWNMKVVKSNGGWTSSTPLYWMNDTDIRFYAFSPYPSSDNGISPFPAGGAPSLQFSAKTRAEEQIDLLRQVTCREKEQYNSLSTTHLPPYDSGREKHSAKMLRLLEYPCPASEETAYTILKMGNGQDFLLKRHLRCLIPHLPSCCRLRSSDAVPKPV